jgi:hypothetical protein
LPSLQGPVQAILMLSGLYSGEGAAVGVPLAGLPTPVNFGDCLENCR